MDFKMLLNKVKVDINETETQNQRPSYNEDKSESDSNTDMSNEEIDLTHERKHTQQNCNNKTELTKDQVVEMHENSFDSLNFHNTLTNFNSYRECKNEICRSQNAREHFHCYDLACLGRKVLIRRKDLLRHIKWHRRQAKSLALGFLRYSNSEDCDRDVVGAGEGVGSGAAFVDSCPYRRKQTHYHCVRGGNCGRVCANLIDAKSHANAHESATMTPAMATRDFHFFIGKDDCQVDFCIYSDMKITHFHCAHANCQFTTKTTTDMATHEAYHRLEPMQQARAIAAAATATVTAAAAAAVEDSRRCARNEAYSAYNNNNKSNRQPSPQQQRQQQVVEHRLPERQQQSPHEQCRSELRADNYEKSLRRRDSEKRQKLEEQPQCKSAAVAVGDKSKMRRHSDSESESSKSSASDSANASSSGDSEKAVRKLAAMEYIQQMLQQQQQLLLLQQQHELLARQNKQEQSSNEAKNTTAAAATTAATKALNTKTNTTTVSNSHRVISAATATTAATTVNSATSACDLSAAAVAANFYQQLATAAVAAAAAADMGGATDVNAALKVAASPVQITSIDGFFNRKRGRPPKNRFVEVYKSTQKSPQAIFTSFKLEKHGQALLSETISKLDLPSTSANAGELDYLAKLQEEEQRYQPQRTIYEAYGSPPLEQSPHKRLQRRPSSAESRSINFLSAYSNKSKDGHNPGTTSLSPMTVSLTDAFNLERYEHFISGEFDCHVEKCRLRKTCPHLHCKSCQQQVPALDLRTHVCSEEFNLRNLRQRGYEDDSGSVPKSEKVSVVRAAGTFYPENSSSNYGSGKLSATCTKEESKASIHSNNDGCGLSTSAPPSCRAKRRHTEAPATGTPLRNVRHRQQSTATPPATITIAAELDEDMPQDLSMSATTANATNPTPPTTTSVNADCKQEQELLGLHFQQLLTLYQQHQQMIYGAAGIPAYALPALMPQQLQQLQLAVAANPAIATSLLSESSTALPPPAVAQSLSMMASFFNSFSNKQHPLLSMPIAGTTTEKLNNVSLSPTAAPTTPVAATGCGKSRPSITSSLLHKLKDDRIPTGYLKFRFNEDCGFPKCGYRNHQSHFHCNRLDCHYSFCDKTRFVQHTARHERLDTLMGDDFFQYRANMSCGHEQCPYARTEENASADASASAAKKSSHFHCRKCDFICSDTNKVVAHRRLHSKMEYIRLAGFRKVASNENCRQGKAAQEQLTSGSGERLHDDMDLCPYSMKHTHYHCLVCDCSVLSRAQLATHKHKMIAAVTATTTTAVTTSV